MKFVPMLTSRVEIGVPVSTGEGPTGRRVVYPIDGGTFSGVERGGRFRGQELKGDVVMGGGDWALVVGDHVKLDIRMTLLTSDEFTIYVSVFGILRINERVLSRVRNPDAATEFGDTYFVTQPRFETGNRTDGPENPYRWLNKSAVVAEGKLGRARPGHMAAKWIDSRWYLVEH